MKGRLRGTVYKDFSSVVVGSPLSEPSQGRHRKGGLRVGPVPAVESPRPVVTRPKTVTGGGKGEGRTTPQTWLSVRIPLSPPFGGSGSPADPTGRLQRAPSSVRRESLCAEGWLRTHQCKLGSQTSSPEPRLQVRGEGTYRAVPSGLQGKGTTPPSWTNLSSSAMLFQSVRCLGSRCEHR